MAYDLSKITTESLHKLGEKTVKITEHFQDGKKGYIYYETYEPQLEVEEPLLD